MLDSAPTLGSVDASTTQRRKLAAQSLEFNCRNETFRSLFPQYVELLEEQKRSGAIAAACAETAEPGASAKPGSAVVHGAGGGDGGAGDNIKGGDAGTGSGDGSAGNGV